MSFEKEGDHNQKSEDQHQVNDAKGEAVMDGNNHEDGLSLSNGYAPVIARYHVALGPIYMMQQTDLPWKLIYHALSHVDCRGARPLRRRCASGGYFFQQHFSWP